MNCYQYEAGPVSKEHLPLPSPLTRIPCPGGCGGEAVLEPEMTVTKDGVTRTVTPAQCKGTCQTEIQTGHRGRPRLVPTRFELSAPELASTERFAPTPIETIEIKEDDKVGFITPDLQHRVKEQLDIRRLSQSQLAKEIGYANSTTCQYLKGQKSASAAFWAALEEWLDKPPVKVNNRPITDPPETDKLERKDPANAILERLLVSAAQARLAELAPDMADKVTLDLALRWK